MRSRTPKAQKRRSRPRTHKCNSCKIAKKREFPVPAMSSVRTKKKCSQDPDNPDGPCLECQRRGIECSGIRRIPSRVLASSQQQRTVPTELLDHPSLTKLLTEFATLRADQLELKRIVENLAAALSNLTSMGNRTGALAIDPYR